MFNQGRYDSVLTIETKFSAEAECTVRVRGSAEKPQVELSFILKRPNFELYKRAVELLRWEIITDFIVQLEGEEHPIEFNGRVTNIGVNGIVIFVHTEPLPFEGSAPITSE